MGIESKSSLPERYRFHVRRLLPSCRLESEINLCSRDQLKPGPRHHQVASAAVCVMPQLPAPASHAEGRVIHVSSVFAFADIRLKLRIETTIHLVARVARLRPLCET